MQTPTPALPTREELIARAEVLILEFNAIVKIMQTKRFKQLDLQSRLVRMGVYENRQFALIEMIEATKKAIGGEFQLWWGIVSTTEPAG